MKTILLVNPALAYSKWAAPMYPPSPDNLFTRLGLAYLASALKKEGHRVELADLRTMQGWEDYVTQLNHVRPDFVGITMHSVEYSIALKAARLAKEHIRGTLVVAGGIHATMFPNECIASGAFDYVICGEGEITFPKLINRPDAFGKITWGEPPDLDQIPFPDRTLWPDWKERMSTDPYGIEKYRFSLPVAEMINVRGCPYNCSFCCGPGEHQLYTRLSEDQHRIPYIRGRSVANVIEEIRSLIDKCGIRSVMFHDDQFITSPKWVAEFLNEFEKAGFKQYGLKWVTSSRADIICKNAELVRQMAACGLELLIVGFESFSPRILRWFNKGTTVDQNFRAAEILHQIGIKIWANYIIGVPTDQGWNSEDDVLTVAGVMKVNPIHYSPSLYTPVPGSRLFEYYQKNNLISEECSSIEDLSDRGKRAAKLKGVNYEFLKCLTIDNSLFGFLKDTRSLMADYDPLMKGRDETAYLREVSYTAAMKINQLNQYRLEVLREDRHALMAKKSHLADQYHSAVSDLRLIIDTTVIRRSLKLDAAQSSGKSITVAIPVFNGGDGIIRLIQQIKDQRDVGTVEVLVLDSGSEDGTPGKVTALGVRLIEIPRSKFNHGAVRRMAAEIAQGDYVLFTGHDVEPTSTRWLRAAMDALDSNPEISVVSMRQFVKPEADMFSRWQNMLTYREYGFDGDYVFHLNYPDLFDALPPSIKRQVSFVDDVCACYRKTIFQKITFRDMINAEDIDIGIRLAKAGFQMGFMNSSGVYHWHSNPPEYFFKRTYNGPHDLLGHRITQVRDLGITSDRDIKRAIAELCGILNARLNGFRSEPRVGIKAILKFVMELRSGEMEINSRTVPFPGLARLYAEMGVPVLDSEHADFLPATYHLLSAMRGFMWSLADFFKAEKVRHIDYSEFEELTYKSSACVLANFVSNWCRLCRAIGQDDGFGRMSRTLSSYLIGQ
jgi:radical SAM superfamily enzyme YgiQ (UPF0313 family)/GT2 family glycosyltransferase